MNETQTPVIEPLGRHHDRAAFSCGVEALDRYIRQQAGQDERRNLARVFIAVGDAPHEVAGYYTLSSLSIRLDDMPEELTKRLPHYTRLPAALIGRLAVSLEFQGQHLGEHLLLDALKRIIETGGTVASFAVLVDAKDEHAVSFYEKYDFLRISNYPMRLFLPVAKAKTLFE